MTEPSGRIAALSPKRRALLAQRLRAEVKAGPPPAAIPRRQEEGPVRLSFAQERLWFLDRWQPGSPAYNLLDAIRLTGRLDVPRLAAALGEVLRRHESLRTVFVESAGVPYQVAAPALSGPLPVIDLSALPEPVRHPAARALGEAEGRLPFDLARGPLLRARLLRLAAREHLLVLVMHHIAADLWSFGVFAHELGSFYSGQGSSLPELPIRYADFAVWQREWLAGEVLQQQLAFWKGRLAGAPALLDLPADRLRPAVQGSRGALARFALPAPLLAGLRGLAQLSGGTLFMVLLAAYEVLLGRHSGQEDLLLGSPVAGRTRRELEPLIGLFVNTLVLRADLAGDPAFLDLLGRVRESTLGALAHQELPFERLVEELQPERDPSRPPLVQVLFAFQSTPVQRIELPGLTFAPLDFDSGTAKLDLSLFLTEGADELAGAFEYSTDLFDAVRIERLAGHLRVLLEAACAEPRRRISELPLLSEAERRQLARWNDTAAVYPQGLCLHQLFEAQALRTPEAEAVRSEGASLTYRELDARSNGLARWLRAHGAGPEVVVGVLLERSLEMVVALYGVLKAGAAYLPLDPSYPRDRLGLFVADAAPRIVLTARGLADLLPPGSPAVFLDGIGETPGDLPEGDPASLAYVIYTSGSTGRPKGVMNSHRGIVNRILGMQEAYGLGAEDRVLQKTPFSFDVSVWELFWPLAFGSCLVMARPEGHRDPAYLVETIAREGITTLHFVPSMLRAFLDAEGLERCACVRRVIASGEELTADVAALFFERVGTAGLHNLYGPTEAAVDVTFWECRRGGGEARVPIGHPIANLRIHLLDRAGHPAPPGVPGELHIGGAGVGRGYLGRPDLTADRFIPDPFGAEPGGRLYRTGDLARHREDGAIDFLGRIDHQVKIRGFRIELGEIEATLSSHPGVKEAAVLVREVGRDRRLVAFLAPRGGAVDELRQFLLSRLPEFMVPSGFVFLDVLPLTPSGKVDRRALAGIAPEPEREAGPGDLRPRTPVEEIVAGIWTEVLGTERIGARDDFFRLGGHSLLGTQVVSRVRQAFGVEMPLRSVFEAPTLRSFAERLETALSGSRQPAPPILRASRSRALPLSFAQERLWFLDQLEPGSAAYNIPGALRVEGDLDRPALLRSLREIVRRHEVLRTSFPAAEGEPCQAIASSWEIDLPLVDLSGLAGREAAARELIARESLRPFDLARGPLLRVLLVRVEERSHLLLFVLHHAVSDGWSTAIFVRELAALSAPGPELPELPIQYADFAVWQRDWLSGEVLAEQIAYWRERLRGAPPVLDLPTDRPRTPLAGSRSASPLRREVEPGLARALRSLARRRGATPFMLLLSALYALLHRYTGQTDLVVGAPVAGRNRLETEGLIGFFVNTLALRATLREDPLFHGLLARVREWLIEDQARQDLPFEKLVEALQPERSLLHTPLFQVLFNLVNTPRAALELPGLRLELVDTAPQPGKFDLTLTVDDPGEGLTLFLGYRPELFDESTVERMLGHFELLLAGIVDDPERRIPDLPLLTEPERRLLLEWSATRTAPVPGLLVHEMFEAQAERSPGAVAVVCEDDRLTYGELNRRANRLAHRLRRLGVQPEARVGICAERSAEMILGLLAVLKAGGAYVPLDPAYPASRLAFMAGEADARVLLVQEHLADLLPAGLRRVSLGELFAGESEENPARLTSPANLAYVLFTSGSTGRPKGVAVEHRQLAHYAGAVLERLDLDGPASFATVSTLSADLGNTSIFPALLTGGTLHVLKAERAADPAAMAGYFGRETVDCLKIVPSHLRALRAASLPVLPRRRLVFGGEALPWADVDEVRALAPGCAVLNHYGPTESTVGVLTHRIVDGAPRRSATVPLGRPLANVRVYVVDAAGQPVPAGIPGELLLGGAGLARGYLGRPELTAERFVPDPFGVEPGARLYRTGDLVRHLPDGALEFLGRIDQQVKIRGFRVEPGEVEAALKALPGVGAAAVVACGHGAGDRRLVAWLVPAAGAELSSQSLRDLLAGSLPDALVPSSFVTLPALPLTPNGKVDRQALARIAPDSLLVAERPYVPPSSAVEQTLADIWADLLQVERVGVQDSFFDLGGHSLLATRLLSRVRESFGIDIPLRAIFEAPTVARLAATVLSRQVELQDEAELAQLLAELEELPEEHLP
ncbi:MAG: amino acid adenylation domain-containing protein [Thermoanaerobaculia bacterium]